jgi:hypothetical protein
VNLKLPKNFVVTVDTTDKLTECALTLHDLFDRGMSIDEVHEFVDAVFDTNMQDLFEKYKIRRFDD